MSIAAEIREALDDPQRYVWGSYPWEHLGDAERDVRQLLDEHARLVTALTEIAESDYRGSQSWESQHAHRALVREGLRQ